MASLLATCLLPIDEARGTQQHSTAWAAWPPRQAVGAFFPQPPQHHSPSPHLSSILRPCQAPPHLPLGSLRTAPQQRGSLATSPTAGAGLFCLARVERGCLPPVGGPLVPLPKGLGLGKHFEYRQCAPGMDVQGLSSPEEKCLKKLLALHILFPHSARHSTATSQILKKYKNSGTFKIIFEVFH